MKEGIYLVTHNTTNKKSIVRFVGTAPLLMIEGTFDLSGFMQKGTTTLVNAETIKSIRQKPGDYSFKPIENVEKLATDIKVQELTLTLEEHHEYREYLETTGDKTGLLIKLMRDKELTSQQAEELMKLICQNV